MSSPEATRRRRRPRPLAGRIAPPRWRDPRVVIGVLLVVASVLGTFFLVRASAETVGVYSATRALAPGENVDPADLAVVEVKLPRSAQFYLAAAQGPPEAAVVLEPVAEGELIPARALGGAGELAGRAVSIDVPGSLPRGVARGVRVDLWATPRAALGEEASDPREILADVPVLSTDEDDSGLGAADGARIEVFVASEDLGVLMTSLAQEDHLAVVIIPGGR